MACTSRFAVLSVAVIASLLPCRTNCSMLFWRLVDELAPALVSCLSRFQKPAPLFDHPGWFSRPPVSASRSHGGWGPTATQHQLLKPTLLHFRCLASPSLITATRLSCHPCLVSSGSSPGVCMPLLNGGDRRDHKATPKRPVSLYAVAKIERLPGYPASPGSLLCRAHSAWCCYLHYQLLHCAFPRSNAAVT